MAPTDSSILMLVSGLVARVTAAFDLVDRSGPGRGPAAMLVGVGPLAQAFVGTVRFYEGAELDRWNRHECPRGCGRATRGAGVQNLPGPGPRRAGEGPSR